VLILILWVFLQFGYSSPFSFSFCGYFFSLGILHHSHFHFVGISSICVGDSTCCPIWFVQRLSSGVFMAQSKVPKFGAWESEEDMGYTVRFDTVRKGNPGGPRTNPYDDIQPKPKKKQPEFGAWEDGEEEVPYTQFFENKGKTKASPPREPQMSYNVGPIQPIKAVQGGDYRKGNPNTRPTNAGESRAAASQGVKFVEASSKQSPLHPGGRNAHVAPRQRPQATATVPVFGDWNTNPTQADGYTVVFKKLQEDKRNGNVSSVDTTPSRPPAQKQSKFSNPFSGFSIIRISAHPHCCVFFSKVAAFHGSLDESSSSAIPKFGAWESEEDMGYTVRFDTIRKGNPGGPITNPYDDIQPNNPKPKKKQPKCGARKDGKEKVRYPYPLKATTLTSEPALADGYTAAYSDTKSKVGTKWRSPQKPPSGPRTKQPKVW
ncbi:hypothetical protein V2J09_002138, partial [Rumex salicifolius]